MKNYRLKQWYPSLDEEWDTTHRYEYQSSTDHMCNKSKQHCVIIYKKELHSDFWEEVEEPLFITDDEVDIFSEEAVIYIVNKNFYKKETELCNIYDKSNREDFKYFFHESNADEYIWRKKKGVQL